MVGMLAGNGHAVLVNVGKVSLGMPFTARRKIVHSNFSLNSVLTFRESLLCLVPRWTLPIAFAVFYLIEQMYVTRFLVFLGWRKF
jgi:hypothetical protein